MKNRFGDELEKPIHIGDGVYIGHDGYQLWIGIHDGPNEPVGTIALEPRTLELLNKYVKSLSSKE